MDRFFIDECRGARLVAAAKARDLDADFGPHIGIHREPSNIGHYSTGSMHS